MTQKENTPVVKFSIGLMLRSLIFFNLIWFGLVWFALLITN